MFRKQAVAALVAEFVGTGLLTLAVLSVQRSTIGVPYFVALGAGLVAAMLGLVFGSISGGYANPAITIALWTARKLSSVTTVLYVAVQLLGGWAAYALYSYFANTNLTAVGGAYTGRVLVAEAVGAFVLALGFAVVAYRNNLTAGARAALVGISLAIGIVVAATVGIGLINPAVALGINAWSVFGSMGWGTYVLGPVLGAVIGVNLYGLLFADVAAAKAIAAEAVVVEEVVVTETVTPTASKKTVSKKTSTKGASTTKKAAVKKPAAKKTAKK